jgi:hypothetical protein
MKKLLILGFVLLVLAFAGIASKTEHSSTAVYFNFALFENTIKFAYSDAIPYLVFVPTTLNSKNVPARWQTNTMGIFNITNNCTDYIKDIYLQLNETSATHTFSCANNSNVNTSKEITTGYTLMYSGNLSFNKSTMLYCWMNYTLPLTNWNFDVYQWEVHW